MRLACPGTIVLALSACSASRIIWPSSAQPLPPPPWSLATHAGTPRFCALLARARRSWTTCPLAARSKSFARECFGYAGSGRQLTNPVPCPSSDRWADLGLLNPCRVLGLVEHQQFPVQHLSVKLVSRSRPASGRPPAPAQVAVFESHAHFFSRTFSTAVDGLRAFLVGSTDQPR